jgi:hypothetical protein
MTRRPQRQKPLPFTLSDDARRQLAEILRPLRNPAATKRAIDAIERRARDFVGTRPASITNANAAVRESAGRLRRACTLAADTIQALPPRTRDGIAERLLLERAVPPGLLAEVRRDLRLLAYAAERVRADAAPAPKGGRPVDRRGQTLAADVALILSDYGVEPTEYTDGPLARCLTVIFEAVRHPPGDMRTLLAAVVRKLGGKPLKTF